MIRRLRAALRGFCDPCMSEWIDETEEYVRSGGYVLVYFDRHEDASVSIHIPRRLTADLDAALHALKS